LNYRNKPELFEEYLQNEKSMENLNEMQKSDESPIDENKLDEKEPIGEKLANDINDEVKEVSTINEEPISKSSPDLIINQ
jgi:hypothetical protein